MSACDSLFAPVETRLAARPATKYCCGCCCGLRHGTVTACALLCLYFLAEATGRISMVGSIVLPFGAFAQVVMFLPGAVIYGMGGWSTYQRNTRGLRWLVRYQLIFCVVLVCLLPFTWLLIKFNCTAFESTRNGDCASATNGTACLAMQEDHAVQVAVGEKNTDPECVWDAADGSCTPILGGINGGTQQLPSSLHASCPFYSPCPSAFHYSHH